MIGITTLVKYHGGAIEYVCVFVCAYVCVCVLWAPQDTIKCIQLEEQFEFE